MAMPREELGRQVGLTGQAIGNYEGGERRPDMDVLLRIAEVLGQPVTFFLRPGVNAPEVFGTRFFRSVGPKSNRTNAALDVKTKWLWEVVDRVSRFIRLPATKLPMPERAAGAEAFTQEEVEGIATATRRFWGLGDGPIANMIALLETNGVVVSRLEMGSERVDAFSCWIEGRPYILLGSDKESCCRSRFDAAHELGHLVLHRGIAQDELAEKRVRERLEREAHWFAGAFLFPRAALLAEFYSTRTSHLIGLKRRWRMSMQAIAHHCKEVGQLDEAQYILFRKQVTKQKWLRKEPLDDEIPLEQPGLLPKAVRLLIDREIVPPSGFEGENGFSLEMVQRLCGIVPEPAAPRAPTLTLVSG